jgi:mono/diheme cytochrome c family protein
MQKVIIPAGLLATAGFLAVTARTQAPPQAPLLITRMSSAYRSLQSFHDVATIKRKEGKKELTATLTLALQKPSKYLLELKGEHLNTWILNDGTNIVAVRPDKKAYTKMKAPTLFMRSDPIGPVDLPTPGPAIITQMLTGNAREGKLGQLLLNAKVTGPQPLGAKQAYVLSFPYAEGIEAQVAVTADDNLVRQVKLVQDGEAVWVEDHETIQLDKPVPAETFTRPLPEGARLFTSLPALEKPVEVAAEPKKDTGSPDTNSDPKIVLGRTVFQSSGCARCHAIGGKGGRMGPDLSHVGAERSAKWIMDHVRNPQAHEPSSRMPAFEGRMSDQNLQALGAYLAGLK